MCFGGFQVLAAGAKYKWPTPAANLKDRLLGLHPCETAQAFSHYTYMYTRRELLVVDLQGKVIANGKRQVLRLTDPAIHSWSGFRRNARYGQTDKGEDGMRKFFKYHQCNVLCDSLGIGMHDTSWR